MSFRFVCLILSLLAPALLSAATLPAYTNLTSFSSPPSNAPNIDAKLFVNKAYFEVNDIFGAPGRPFETDNTLSFINDVAGTMAGTPGFRFDYFRPNLNWRGWMSSWVNRNLVTTDSAFSTNFFFFSSTAQWILISATNIVNSGFLNAGPQSLIEVKGRSVNLSRGRLRTGVSENFRGYSGGSYLGSTNNYFNDLGITDTYWGEGQSNVLGGQAVAMQLNVPGGFPSFSPPYRSAIHEAISQSFGFTFTNQFALGDSSFFVPQNNVIPFAYQTQVGNEFIVQVVFVKTNFFEPHIFPEVRFIRTDADAGRTAVVAFHSRERDVALERDVTNSVYLLDALAFNTNVVLARNQTAPTRRPNSFEVTKGIRFTQFSLTNQSAPNVPYSPTLLYTNTFTDSDVGVQYAAYGAQIASFSLLPSGAGSDPTNFPGRIEITADTLNLKETRIRTDSTLILQANDLVSNSLARINAPFINFDVGTSQPSLVISNLAPASVNRLSGGIQAWSATWRNTEVTPTGATNNWRFHVLFVDNTLTTNQPVRLNKFHVRANDVVICDPLTVGQSLRLEGTGVHVKTNAALIFPPGSSWSAASVVNVVNFTNDGRVSIPGGAFVGSDRGFGYENFVNRGTNDASVWSIISDWFENPGCIAATAGSFDVIADRIKLEGPPPTLSSNLVFNFETFTIEWQLVTNFHAKIAAVTDVNLDAPIVTMSNAHLVAGAGSAPGAVIITALQRLTDAGPQHTNHWITTGGIRVPRRPTQLSDLMGTYALVQSPPFSQVQNVWDGKNLGAVRNGYSNNLALGKLTLDGGEFSRIHFSGAPGKDNALYVDYLELLNNATNYTDPEAISFDSNIRIYYANANVGAAKLNRAQGEHFRWVPSFYGPLSTTNIVYPSGNVYQMNVALAQDKDADSDGDGTVNSKDRTPIYTAESIGLKIAHDVQPTRVLLSWQAMVNSTSYVEYRPVIASTGPWTLLHQTSAPASMRLSVTDPTTGRAQRIYRVRVDLPQQ